MIETARANSLDRFELGVRKLIEGLMVERHGENDEIVERYLDDPTFQAAIFPILAREIFTTVRAAAADLGPGNQS